MNPEIDPYKYAQLIFNKGVNTIQRKKGKSFQQTILVQLDIHKQKKKKDSDLILIHYAKTHNEIAYLNVKHKTINRIFRKK